MRRAEVCQSTIRLQRGKDTASETTQNHLSPARLMASLVVLNHEVDRKCVGFGDAVPATETVRVGSRSVR